MDKGKKEMKVVFESHRINDQVTDESDGNPCKIKSVLG